MLPEAAFHGRTLEEQHVFRRANFDIDMKHQSANDQPSLGRARARRTALIVGAVAIAIYLVAIGEVVLHR